MTQNPFTSSSFENIWSKHFNESKPLLSFKFIGGVKFVKESNLGIYVNVGKNLTKGIDYYLNYSETDYKGKTLLIYDVPAYFNLEEFAPPKSSSLKIKKIFQYQGFLMDLSGFKDKDDYINAHFSSKNRREFRSNQRRLEECFDITYEFVNEAMPRHKFDKLFKQFHTLLSQRFDGKRVNYHHLSQKKWDYYSELVFEMLKEKKASLLAIYNKETAIGITLNFHADTVLFETITVFDPDYYKFSIGKTSIIKLLEWCFENNYQISDFSKGDFDYKHKWGNLRYDFNYHILYDSKSILSVLRSKYVELFYRLKLYLRKKKVNELYRKYKYLISGQSTKDDLMKKNFKITTISEFDSTDFELIDYNIFETKFLLVFIYTFAFAYKEPVENIKVFRKKNDSQIFFIKGSNKSQKIHFT